ncbi:Zona pellucida sperm-binding protein 3, partial [Ophiophagus hannah]
MYQYQGSFGEMQVSVSCGSSHLLITVPVNLFGNSVMVNANELILGSGCKVTAVYPNVLLLEYPLFACEATRQLLPESIHYKNILHYVPSAPDGVIRTNPFSHAINCFYPRCFVDGQHGGSHFLATREDGFLRFQLDTFTFIGASNNQIYLICHLKAVPVGSANHLNKACSYDKTTATWSSHEGVDCSCCASHTGCGSKKRQRRQQQRRGTFGERDLTLGPIELKGEQAQTSLQNSTRTLELVSIVTNFAPAISNTSAAGPSLNQMANIIVRKEKMKEDVTGFHLPFSTATIVILVACSFIVLVSILGCFYSNKHSHRRYQMGMMQSVLRETNAVAMAPASVGTSGTGTSGQSNITSIKPDDLVAVF